jgi:hypothetical protein
MTLGEVPAATMTLRAGSVTVRALVTHLPSFSSCVLQRSASTALYLSRIASSGSMRSMKEIPSSSALMTSSWLRPVGGRVLHGLAVRDRDAAPAAHERDEVGASPAAAARPALFADRAAVLEELAQDLGLLLVEGAPDLVPALPAGDRLVAVEHLLHLARVVRGQLGGRVDRREPAADDDGRQPRLQVRERVLLRGAGELQRHQEVARLADPAGEVVLHLHDRRPSRAGGDRDVIEAQRPGVLGGQRAAEADAAEDAQLLAAREREVEQRQEVLVPADRDAVLGDAAESLEDARVERPVDLFPRGDRLGGTPASGSPVISIGSGSILSPSTPTTPKPSLSRWCASV